MNKIISLLCGIIFGIGLVISEMINPAKVLGFLNIFDEWDPSLAFVMVGALIISTPFFHLFKKKDKPFFATNFLISNATEIDKKLIIAGAMVGFGTRLSNVCTSGHGISGISRFSIRSIIATITFMLVGILTVLITGIL